MSLLVFFVAGARQLDSVQRILDRCLDEANVYERAKIDRIKQLKRKVYASVSDAERYRLHKALYEEYRKYQLDSALLYVERNIILASQLGNGRDRDRARLAYAHLLSTMGKFIESKKLLDEIPAVSIDTALLVDYYRTQSAFYSHYGLSSNNPDFFQVSEQYRDSMLNLLDTSSSEYRLSRATKLVYARDFEHALPILQQLISEMDDMEPDKAFVAYLLSLIYRDTGNRELQMKYLGISAICDIKNVIKDNASMQGLAVAYYELGDIDRANTFIEKAINDAVFSNVRFRTIESSSFYPIIYTAFVEKETQRQKELLLSLAVISVLSVLLLIGVVYIYQQMDKLKRARMDLAEINQQLTSLNKQLVVSNEQLKESNHIKEEYITQFFDMCSTYINKIDVMRKELLKKALSNSFDSIKKDLQSSNFVKSELEDLYRNFDMIFINLYPTFVTEFNALLDPDEQIVLKEEEILNSELRIYALVRLGISDNAKIAGFLRYSLRTVYNYRVKTRNKVKGSKADFDKRIMDIGNS